MSQNNYVTPLLEEGGDAIVEAMNSSSFTKTNKETCILNSAFKFWCKKNKINPIILESSLKEAVLRGDIRIETSTVPDGDPSLSSKLTNYTAYPLYKLYTSLGRSISTHNDSLFFKFFYPFLQYKETHMESFNKKARH